MSFTYQAHQNLSGNASSLVRNELMHSDIRTGKSVSLRTTGLEEPPIQMIRVSHLKQVETIIINKSWQTLILDLNL